MKAAIQWRDFGAALVVLAAAIAFLAWARSYSAEEAAAPALVAWLTLVLSLVDAVARTETRAGRLLGRLVSVGHVVEWRAGSEAEAGARRVLASVFWVLAYLAGVLVVGFLVATPAYVFLYMALYGRKRLRSSALGALLTTAAIWGTFELLFRYPLYPGALFGG